MMGSCLTECETKELDCMKIKVSDMDIVIQERPSDFSGGALQALGNIGTSALNAAVDGVATSMNANNKAIIDDGLKLFGNFERNTFEFAKTDGKKLSGLFQNAAEYGKPTQVLSNFAGNFEQKDSFYKDVLKKMEDPQFRVSDGLASFAGKEISETLTGSVQKPGNDVLEKGIIIVNSNPEGLEDKSNFEQKQKGVIYSDSKPGSANDVAEKGIVIINGQPVSANKIPVDQDSLIKLQNLDQIVQKQLDLFQSFNNSTWRTY